MLYSGFEAFTKSLKIWVNAWKWAKMGSKITWSFFGGHFFMEFFSGKLGRNRAKSFAPQKICLLLHLCGVPPDIKGFFSAVLGTFGVAFLWALLLIKDKCGLVGGTHWCHAWWFFTRSSEFWADLSDLVTFHCNLVIFVRYVFKEDRLPCF